MTWCRPVRTVPATAPLFAIHPEAIRVERVSASVVAKQQPNMSRAVWRPAPGRKLGFNVFHDDTLIGLLFLASPVLNLQVRDQFLLWQREGKGQKLRSYMDVSVCVGAQPLAWYWNLGKLLALLAPTLTDEVQAAYPSDAFLGLTTTSLYGRGAQYNRVWRFLGYTKGYGHEHITDAQYDGMTSTLRAAGLLPGNRFGQGANSRMRRIAAYRKHFGGPANYHGNKRGVYYHPAVPTAKRAEVVAAWHARWGLPRYIAKKDEQAPYASGIEERGISLMESTGFPPEALVGTQHPAPRSGEARLP